jgi:hypothetical protein
MGRRRLRPPLLRLPRRNQGHDGGDVFMLLSCNAANRKRTWRVVRLVGRARMNSIA